MKHASATHIDVEHAGGSSAGREDKIWFWTELFAAARAGWGLGPFVPVAGHLPAGRPALRTERPSDHPKDPAVD
ncbi:MAG: hypothetical protein AAFU79_34605 [Myxococcota bacterium]